LRHRGYPVTLVYTGRQVMATSLDGVVIRRVGPPEDWRQLSTLALASR
jgi:hypothetical protein